MTTTLESTIEAMPTEKLTRLRGKTRTGDAVHNSQVMSKEKGFANVSKKWLDKCISYEKGQELLQKGYAETEDVRASLAVMTPALNDAGEFTMKHRDGREFKPTSHAVGQMADWAGCGRWYALSLLKSDENTRRDKRDAEALMVAMSNGFRRIENDKVFFWRTRKDGTLRAMLTEQYAPINNEWVMNLVQAVIPGGMLSHWRGDCDTLFGNVLIPDSIRDGDDSDYGGMLSLGNSEIGERRLESYPSIFRAICQNGNIWDREVGSAVSVRHRGKIDLDELAVKIRENLLAQIPLLPQGIEKLLSVKSMKWDGASILPLFAQVAKTYKLSKKQATEVLKGYTIEKSQTPDLAKTLFSVVNAITRAGQSLSNDEWLRFDTIGGDLIGYTTSDWSQMKTQAKRLKEKEVHEMFASMAA